MDGLACLRVTRFPSSEASKRLAFPEELLNTALVEKQTSICRSQTVKDVSRLSTDFGSIGFPGGKPSTVSGREWPQTNPCSPAEASGVLLLHQMVPTRSGMVTRSLTPDVEPNSTHKVAWCCLRRSQPTTCGAGPSGHHHKRSTGSNGLW